MVQAPTLKSFSFSLSTTFQSQESIGIGVDLALSPPVAKKSQEGSPVAALQRVVSNQGSECHSDENGTGMGGSGENETDEGDESEIDEAVQNERARNLADDEMSDSDSDENESLSDTDEVCPDNKESKVSDRPLIFLVVAVAKELRLSSQGGSKKGVRTRGQIRIQGRVPDYAAFFRQCTSDLESDGHCVFVCFRLGNVTEFRGDAVVSSGNRRLEGTVRRNWWGFAGRRSADASLYEHNAGLLRRVRDPKRCVMESGRLYKKETAKDFNPSLFSSGTSKSTDRDPAHLLEFGEVRVTSNLSESFHEALETPHLLRPLDDFLRRLRLRPPLSGPNSPFPSPSPSGSSSSTEDGTPPSQFSFLLSTALPFHPSSNLANETRPLPASQGTEVERSPEECNRLLRQAYRNITKSLYSLNRLHWEARTCIGTARHRPDPIRSLNFLRRIQSQKKHNTVGLLPQRQTVSLAVSLRKWQSGLNHLLRRSRSIPKSQPQNARAHAEQTPMQNNRLSAAQTSDSPESEGWHTRSPPETAPALPSEGGERVVSLRPSDVDLLQEGVTRSFGPTPEQTATRVPEGDSRAGCMGEIEMPVGGRLVETVCLSALGCGLRGYPPQDCARAFLDALGEALERRERETVGVDVLIGKKEGGGRKKILEKEHRGACGRLLLRGQGKGCASDIFSNKYEGSWLPLFFEVRFLDVTILRAWVAEVEQRQLQEKEEEKEEEEKEEEDNSAEVVNETVVAATSMPVGTQGKSPLLFSMPAERSHSSTESHDVIEGLGPVKTQRGSILHQLSQKERVSVRMWNTPSKDDNRLVSSFFANCGADHPLFQLEDKAFINIQKLTRCDYAEKAMRDLLQICRRLKDAVSP
uniref:Uncharacterized protein n=1 Tax=Chromera velia CCMP2878 TaxID=1169474 RepID=A0A0G4FWY4_9ALVE|eukprot:Cvel_3808.t1-p1 / transcript=Cvel_3808.t1 / gene=Cvel_3808 / organism=Chromera_velia_CCMP2878 / gene_product=hypothetical protein / transcript_product=hypothetical protein / location=Cvel_scaffold160:88262-92012(+) / protein_length=864 / sequence_SO=supercontig / SO=protein_coding / is_pseudo=false